MFYKKRVIIILISIIPISCVSQKNSADYTSCMQKSLRGTDIDFYNRINKLEKRLLDIGALKSNNKKGYVKAFNSLLSKNDTVWKVYQRKVSENLRSDFVLKDFEYYLISLCSVIDSPLKNNNCNCKDIHKFFLKKFTYKPYDDEENIDGLLLSTNFENKILRLNVTYVLLINMENKYGK